jgi:hypothetical protein
MFCCNTPQQQSIELNRKIIPRNKPVANFLHRRSTLLLPIARAMRAFGDPADSQEFMLQRSALSGERIFWATLTKWWPTNFFSEIILCRFDH